MIQALVAQFDGTTGLDETTVFTDLLIVLGQFGLEVSRSRALLREPRGHLPPWLSTWVDEEKQLFGSDLELSLKTAINDEVDLVVPLLSRDAVESSWARREIQ